MYHKIDIIHNGNKHRIKKDLDTGDLYLYQNGEKFLLDKQYSLTATKTRSSLEYLFRYCSPPYKVPEKYYEFTIDNPFTPEQIDQIQQIFKKDYTLQNHLDFIVVLCLCLIFIFFNVVFCMFVPQYSNWFFHVLFCLFVSIICTILVYGIILMNVNLVNNEIDVSSIEDDIRTYTL